jgi:hypothetical protein
MDDLLRWVQVVAHVNGALPTAGRSSKREERPAADVRRPDLGRDGK